MFSLYKQLRKITEQVLTEWAICVKLLLLYVKRSASPQFLGGGRLYDEPGLFY
jgi:hypothetical protein